MAEITTGILCDYAQVREGMLSLLSGGVTRRRVPQIPAMLGVMLAMLVEIPADEQAQAHELVVSIRKVDTAEDVASAVQAVQVQSADTFPGESVYVPSIADLRQVPASTYGPYDVAMSIDDVPGPRLTLYVVKPPTG